jgi:zona occludens toxin (predicted ATPase)
MERNAKKQAKAMIRRMNDITNNLQQGNQMLNRKQSLTIKVLSLSAISFLYAGTALASPLTFTGQNAALFNTANPNDTAAMMNSVVKPTPKTPLPSGLDQSRLIIQGLESQITNKIYSDIFDTSLPSGGPYILPDGGTISFKRIGGNIEITVVADGTTSVIVLPDI